MHPPSPVYFLGGGELKRRGRHEGLPSPPDCFLGATWLNTSKPKASDLGEPRCAKVLAFQPRWGDAQHGHSLPTAGSRCSCSQLRVVDLSKPDGRLQPPSGLAFSFGALATSATARALLYSVSVPSLSFGFLVWGLGFGV